MIGSGATAELAPSIHSSFVLLLVPIFSFFLFCFCIALCLAFSTIDFVA